MHESAEVVERSSGRRIEGVDLKTRLNTIYHQEIVPGMTKQFGYRNVMEVPCLQKVVINMGVGEAIQTPNLMDGAVRDMTAITGQKPSIRRSKKAISNFKLRAGVPVGCSVTLRRDRMYEFMDRFLNFAIPRIRDFRGVSPNSFDGRGNYTLGIKEQIIFPEIDYDKIDRIRGMDVTIVTTAKTDEEAFELLRLFGMPFSGN